MLVTVVGGGTTVKTAVNVAVIWPVILVNISTSSILIDHTLLFIVRSKDSNTTCRKAWTSMYMIWVSISDSERQSRALVFISASVSKFCYIS